MSDPWTLSQAGLPCRSVDVETATESSRSGTAPRFGFIATSAFASAVGVIVAVLVDHLGVAIAGALAGREPALYHNDVLYSSGGSDLALGGGMILSLLTAAFFLTLYPGSKRYDAARLTTLWIVLHCFRQGFTPLATMPFSPESRIARAFETLDVPAGLDLVIAAAGAVGLLAIALASAPAFLGYAQHRRDIATPQSRFLFTVKLALIPGVVGPLLAVPVFLPDSGTGFIQTLPLFGLFTVATVLAALGTRTVRIEDYRQTQMWSWLPLAWFLVLAVIFQVILSRGLYIPPSPADPFMVPL